MKGIVVKSTGSWYLVRTEDGKILECRIKGVLRIHGIKSTNPVAVGDRVSFEMENDEKGIISGVEERKNYIIRRSTNLSKQTQILAANIDMAYLFATVINPRTSEGFIDRFLMTAEAYSIPATIIINKKDIYDKSGLEFAEHLLKIYSGIGYPAMLLSTLNAGDVKALIQLCKGKVNLFAGHSGTGKTTMLNSMEPSFSLKTGIISEAHFKGKHTTTFAEMHALSEGGYVIDTPGIKEFGIVHVEKNELSHFFPEIFKTSPECKFTTCLHVNEPKCAVIRAVEEGKIAVSRYNSYLNIISGTELDKEYSD